MTQALTAMLVGAIALAGCGARDDPAQETPAPTSATTTTRPPEPTSDTSTPTGGETVGPTAPPTTQTTPPFTIDAFTDDELMAAGYETAGCWFHSAADRDESLLYGGITRMPEMSAGGYLKVDGQPIALTPAQDPTVGDPSIVTAYTADGYDVDLKELGEPVATSNEGNERAATLVVTASDGAQVTMPGILWCGV
jgi:hypothetical protein